MTERKEEKADDFFIRDSEVKEQTSPSPAPKRRRWPLLKVALVGMFGLIATVIASFAYWWYACYAEVNARLAALEDQGLPTNVAAVAESYQFPDGEADLTDSWMRIIDETLRSGAEPPMNFLSGSTPPPGEAWAELDEARATLSRIQKELEQARDLAHQQGEVRYPIEFQDEKSTTNPLADGIRVVARLLVLDAHVAAHEGDAERALEDIRTVIAISDTLRAEPIIISQIIRIAIYAMGANAVGDLLPHTHWSDEQLQSLQQLFREADFAENLQRGLNGARGMALSDIDNYAPLLVRPSNKLLILDWFEWIEDDWESGWAHRLDQYAALETRKREYGKNLLTILQYETAIKGFPVTSVSLEASTRSVARQRILNAIIAAQRHRLRHGELPDSLEAIDKDLLGPESETTKLIDPFDGKPLRLLIEDNQYLIYSIGENRKDDGGNYKFEQKLRRPEDYGYSLER